MYADVDGLRVEARPGLVGFCPSCDGDVTAKCGHIVIWHWAHRASQDCDAWTEPETIWHRSWKQRFPIGSREVVIGNHRADVSTPFGVLEVQHSGLSVDDIRSRERHYVRMCWLWDARDAYAEGRIELRRKPQRAPNWRSFRWKQPRKSIAACNRPSFLHLADGMVLALGKLFPAAPAGGWGHLLAEPDVVRMFTQEAA